MADVPPVIPAEFQQYNSYVTDPQWQRKFSYIWAGVAGVFIVLAIPRVYKSIKTGTIWACVTGVTENLYGKKYGAANATESPSPLPPRKLTWRRWNGLQSVVKSFTLWMPPLLDLTVGQIGIVIVYFVIVLVCIITQAPLIDNPNRAGFLALAQLPVVFLFATKNSILSLALGPGNGWEKLNFIHRWSGRGMFLAAAIHGSLWIRNHLQYGLPIIGPQKETSGVATFGLLCVIVLSSLKPVRYWAYQFFFVIHVLGFVAFFVSLCYHTPYASPWIFPPLAFYGLDMLMRMFRYRIKDATLISCDDQMTIIHVNDCDGGWIAGQHVRLRVFFGSRLFESHPLTILSAPPSHTCLEACTLTLGARVMGDWTRALNTYARTDSSSTAPEKKSLKEKEREIETEDKVPWLATGGVPVQVMIDGPYGGCSVDLGEYESVLLIAGGSGATFTLGLLDDIIGRCVKLGRRQGEKTRRIEFAWCIKSFACIDWFAPMLMEIALLAATDSTIDLHISVFVTCLCNPENVPPIPNSDVTIERPTITQLLKELIAPPTSVDDEVEVKLRWNGVGRGGGVAVCAAGPQNLTREARNAVASVSLVKGTELGGIACHTEEYTL